MGISWTIVGGESGHHARPFDLAWARAIRDQCVDAETDVPVFIKQLGARPVTECGKCDDRGRDWLGETCRLCDGTGLYTERLNDRAGADPSEWPDSLRVREFPEA